MGRIVIELTNRCNLSCQHCFSGRHGGRDDLALNILNKILAEASGLGFDFLTFTGGDPTTYRDFEEALRLTYEAGYDFGFNTNGWNFQKIYPVLLPYRERLKNITFSLDGATEETHDRLRGKGSFRRVMQAFSICVMVDLPFAINMVITDHNRHEIKGMSVLAAKLGSQGLRFGHLMPAPLTTRLKFDLSLGQRKSLDAAIWDIRDNSAMPIAMAPGNQTTNLFPCLPLNGAELNVDCHGNLTKCCHLSGMAEGDEGLDILGDLHSMSLSEAYDRFMAENEQFRRQKLEQVSDGPWQDSDYNPCWYCSKKYKKVDWLAKVSGNPWSDLLRSETSV